MAGLETPLKRLAARWDIWRTGARIYAVRKAPLTAVELDAGCVPLVGAIDEATLAGRIGILEDLAVEARAAGISGLPEGARGLAAALVSTGLNALALGQTVELRFPGRELVTIRPAWVDTALAWMLPQRRGCNGHIVPRTRTQEFIRVAVECANGHRI